MNRKRILIAAVLLCSFATSCGSVGVQRVSQTESGRIVEDSEWFIEPLQSLPIENALFNIACAEDGWCCLWNFKSVWAGNDKGSWQQIYSGDALRNVFVDGRHVVWIATSDSIYKKEGDRWINISWPRFDGVNGEIGCVYFQGQNGWIAGAKYRPLETNETLIHNATSADGTRVLSGYLSHTADGGKLWESYEFPRLVGRFHKILFATELGIAYGDAGFLATTNGGKTWKKPLEEFRNRDTGELPNVQAAFIANDQQAWVAVNGGRILTTSDGGKNWRLSSPNIPDSLQTFSDIAFTDQSAGLAISGGTGGGSLFKTSDSGKSWRQIPAPEPFRQVLIIAGHGILVGSSRLYSIRKL